MAEDGEEKNVLAEQGLAQKLLDNGVGVQPGEEHSEQPGWFRLVFSCDREVLEVGLRRSVHPPTERVFVHADFRYPKTCESPERYRAKFVVIKLLQYCKIGTNSVISSKLPFRKFQLQSNPTTQITTRRILPPNPFTRVSKNIFQNRHTTCIPFDVTPLIRATKQTNPLDHI